MIVFGILILQKIFPNYFDDGYISDLKPSKHHHRKARINDKDEAQRLVGKEQDEEEFEEAEEALSRLAIGFKSLIFGEPLYCYKRLVKYVTNHELKDEINKLYHPVLCFDALQRKFGKHGYSLKFGLQQRENNKQSVIIVNFPDGGCKMVCEVTKHNDVNHILACPRIYYRGPYKFTEIASPDLEVLIIGWNCYTMVGILIKARLLS